jgi:tRNA(fMet)-specific endonuclease VapC
LILADTDVLIDFLNNRRPASEKVEFLAGGGRLATTAINRFELLYGLTTLRSRELASGLFEVVRTLPVTDKTAERSAAAALVLRRKGLSLPPADLLIAGVALEADMPLYTRNIRHFDRIEGLRLHNVR